MISLNVFSLVDLLGLIISTHVLFAFGYRTVRVTRRDVDVTFTVVMALLWLEAFAILAVDNLVPSNTPAATVPGAGRLTLAAYRGMYVIGTFLMIAMVHFALRYTQHPRWSGKKVLGLYAIGVALAPLYFSSGFLSERTVPLAPASSWRCAVPYQPVSGPLTVVFLGLWLGANLYVQWLFWRHRRISPHAARPVPLDFVWLGVALWGAGGLLSIALGVVGYAGVDPSMVIFSAAMSVLAVGLGEDYLRSEEQRKHVTRRFESYVDPALVRYVIEHPDTEQIEGEVRELTVVFTDLEGFTQITERLREGAVTLLNEYLRLMVPLIRGHNGYRNKFLGDGMMFFYGAPEKNPDHAIHAVATVLKMQEMMSTFNELLAARRTELGPDLPQLLMRTGVSSGQMIVGDAGPAEASDYTVLGDTVNLGARLESANKQLGTRILLSERTVELVPSDLFVLRPVGRIQVAGLSRAVMTYEPLAHAATATPRHRRTAELHGLIVRHFGRGDFGRCLEQVAVTEAELGAARLTSLYRDLCERHRREPPPPGFSGEIILHEK